MTQILWLRHAQRKMTLEDDPSLTEEGQQQAQRICSLLSSQIEGASITLCSSPKTRCQQTLQPLSKTLGETVRVERALDERQLEENGQEFRRRIQMFLEDVLESPAAPRTLLCTHSDWLEEAIALIPNQDPRIDQIQHFPHASLFMFEVIDGFWQLRDEL